MPYIRKERRREYSEPIEQILKSLPGSPEEAAGEFTYVVYTLLAKFNGRYWERALGTGSVMMAVMEMYRTSHARYEDEKMAEHGDV